MLTSQRLSSFCLSFIILLSVACTPAVTPTVTPQAERPQSQSTSVASLASPTVTIPLATPTFPPATPTQTNVPVQTPTVPAASTFDADAALAHINQLADTHGIRVAGSKNFDAAADYVAGQFATWGYEVEKQAFPITYFEVKQVDIAVTEPANSAVMLQPIPLTFSGAGNMDAELVHGKVSKLDDLKNVDMQGKIILLVSDGVQTLQKINQAKTGGAAAILIVGNDTRLSGANLSTSEQQLPTLGLSQDEGAALEALLQNGPVKLKLLVDVVQQPGITHNVIATKPGTSGQMVVIGGHMDTVPAGPGSNDNASGTATFMEVAHALADETFPHTVRFIAFGGHEIGMHGSQYYIKQLRPDERRAILAMLNLDMVGIEVGPGLRFGTDRNAGFGEQMVQLAEELGYKTSTFNARGASDHTWFAEVGVPVAFVHTGIDRNYHSANDRPEYIERATIDKVGGIILQAVRRLARTGSLLQ